jgi:hypothetical protein
VERKAKFQGLIRDADSTKPGVYTNKSKRSFYCRMAVALSLNIRNHFTKHISENAGLVQVTIPTLENTHPSQERFLIPIANLALRKVKPRRNAANASESSLEGLDLLSATISSQDMPPGFELDTSNPVEDVTESDLDESEVLGMVGALGMLRAYNSESAAPLAAVTFCENVYNRTSIPAAKDSKDHRGKGRDRSNGHGSGEDDATMHESGDPFQEFGFSIQQTSYPAGPCSITSVVTGSAAHSFGIRNGDVVTHVDGKSVEGLRLEAVVALLLTDGVRPSFEPVQEPPLHSNALQDMCHVNLHHVPPFLRLGWLKRKVYERNKDDAGESYEGSSEKAADWVSSSSRGDMKRPLELDERESQVSGGEDQLLSDDERLSTGEPPKKRGRGSATVTSLGCSRGFITCVLARALEHVKALGPGASISFPFANADITAWMQLAAEDCLTNKEYQLALGGTQFSIADPTTYWSNPQQFLTWWKNKYRTTVLLLRGSSC